jgi:hypothetical protein
MHLWNAYGGRLGHFVVAGEALVAPDGNVELPLADGRTGRFPPDFHLFINWPAMDAAAKAAATPESPELPADPQAEPS